jgi:hypothetical protein
MDTAPMISPYQVAPPQGNLLGSLMDFVVQSRALQQQGATNQYLNQQQGLPTNVDPSAIQNFQGEGQRQQIAGAANSRAQQDQDWRGQDRSDARGSAANIVNSFLQNPEYANDPMVGPMLRSGNNPTVADQVLSILGGDRTANRSFGNQSVLQDDAQASQMEIAKLQEAGAFSRAGQGRGASAGQQTLQAVHEAIGHYQKTGDRMPLLALQATGQISDPQAAGQMMGDVQWNEQAGARQAKAQQEKDGAEAVKALLAGNKTDPKSAAVYAREQPNIPLSGPAPSVPVSDNFFAPAPTAKQPPVNVEDILNWVKAQTKAR